MAFRRGLCGAGQLHCIASARMCVGICVGAQVRLRPLGGLAGAVASQATWYQWAWGGSDAPAESWPSNGYFVTGCSCDPYNPSGAPAGLLVTQSYDHMMFRCVHTLQCTGISCLCESALHRLHSSDASCMHGIGCIARV